MSKLTRNGFLAPAWEITPRITLSISAPAPSAQRTHDVITCKDSYV